jgi:RNA polymerase sigma factor (TIGR02999 family)
MTDDVTELLARWQKGDSAAFREVLPVLYVQLKAIADAYLRRERAGHTIQATALVNELYLKLAAAPDGHFASRYHFLSYAASLMRHILVDYARTRRRHRRGGECSRVPLHEDLPWIDADSVEVIDLQLAMDELRQVDERKAQLIDLYFFLGATPEETADALGISRATFFRDLQFTRSWLWQRLRGRN